MNMAPTPSMMSLAPPPVVGATHPTGQERLQAIVGRHFDFIGRFLRSLGAADSEVDDLLQNVFQVAAARLHDIRPGSERAFLAQTAVRLAAGARRERALGRHITMDELPDLADARPSPEDLADRRQALAVLDRVLGDMDLDLRTVLVLYEIEEMTTADIAGVLQIPAGTAASRLRRAREDFGRRLRRAGFGRAQKEGDL